MSYASAGSAASFGKSAASYAQYRPDYPSALYDTILRQGKPPGQAVALDVATGSGQAARGLSQHFARVIALDHDAQQLQHAPSITNVAFVLGSAEDTKLEDQSVDLVAVAAGLHW